jgi:uroporphyrinogen decarboxylase
MTLRERTLAALNHETPDRVPAHFMGMDEMQAYAQSLGLADWLALGDHWEIGVCRHIYTWRGPQPKDRDGNPLQIWGTPHEQSYTCVLYRPLADAQTAADVDAHDWPDPEHCDFAPMRDALKADTVHVRGGCTWDPIFSRLCELFGMERAMENLHLNPVVIEAALAHLEHFYTTYYRNQVEVCGDYLDFLGFGDDFAGQRQLLLRPEHWRKYFKPLFAKWFAIGKAAGLRIWMHACGAIGEVLPDLVDIGLDIWETVQAHLPGNEPQRLKRDFGRRLAFAGGVNCQHVLGRATPEEVRAHVRERIRGLGRGGGYLCGADHNIKPGVPFENVTAMYEAIRDFRGDGCTL